jgi:hypothetical protein
MRNIWDFELNNQINMLVSLVWFVVKKTEIHREQVRTSPNQLIFFGSVRGWAWSRNGQAAFSRLSEQGRVCS